MAERNGRSRILLGVLVVLSGLIYGGCQPGPGTPMEQQEQGPSIDRNAGIEWRLARRGGGIASPGGQTGQHLHSVALSGTRFRRRRKRWNNRAQQRWGCLDGGERQHYCRRPIRCCVERRAVCGGRRNDCIQQ